MASRSKMPDDLGRELRRNDLERRAAHLAGLGRDEVHVSYVIVDGVIDIPRTRESLPDRRDEEFLSPRILPLRSIRSLSSRRPPGPLNSI
jgi:hypothetical protein